MSRLNNALTELASLFRTEGYGSNAATAERAVVALAISPQAACEAIGTREFWGEGDSLFNVPFEKIGTSNRRAILMNIIASEFAALCRQDGPPHPFVQIALERAETLMSWVEQ